MAAVLDKTDGAVAGDTVAQSTAAADDVEGAEDTFKLYLRDNHPDKPVVVRAKATTKVSSLLAAYVSKRSLALSPSRLYLVFDGQKLEPKSTVGDADAEDEDLFDVRGLP
jgi:hypothetical protein